MKKTIVVAGLALVLSACAGMQSTAELDETIAQAEKEIAAAFKAGELKADKFTLFLDRFENVMEGEDTQPEVMSAADKASKRGVLNGKYAESVPGKTGKGLKILKF